MFHFSLIVIFIFDLSLYFHSILIMPMLHDENDDGIPGKEVSISIKPAKRQREINALPDVIASHTEEDKDLIIILEEIDPHQRSSTYGKPFRIATSVKGKPPDNSLIVLNKLTTDQVCVF